MCSTNEKGLYHLKAPTGEYVIVVSSVGFEKVETKINIKSKVENPGADDPCGQG